MMDLQRILLWGLCIWEFLFMVSIVDANVVFRVEHKFKGKKASSFNLSDYRAHDARRHARMLSAVDIPIGGDGNPSETGLYYAKIQLGTPPKDFHVQVDTGSDILWLNCAGCTNCPVQSKLGIQLSYYDGKASSSSSVVDCSNSLCSMMMRNTDSDCQPQATCDYQVTYGDGSTTSGFFVKDEFTFDVVTGDKQFRKGNSSIVFGCSANQGGGLSQSNDQSLDGIMGFGNAKSSTLSQLAAAKKAPKVFSHCLDSHHGGGIFTIGEVIQPKLSSTPILENMPHYNVLMTGMEVDGDVMKLGSGRPAIVDSGTTLVYLPDDMFERLMSSLLAKQPDLSLETVSQQFKCFDYSGNIDDAFPTVKFHFDESLTMTIYAHDYLFSIKENTWCFGWMNSGIKDQDGSDVILLGDLALNNRLFVYDLVKGVIGWKEYNCSSSIKLKDDSGGVTSVNGQSLSSAHSSSRWNLSVAFLLMLISILYTIIY